MEVDQTKNKLKANKGRSQSICDYAAGLITEDLIVSIWTPPEFLCVDPLLGPWVFVYTSITPRENKIKVEKLYIITGIAFSLINVEHQEWTPYNHVIFVFLLTVAAWFCWLHSLRYFYPTTLAIITYTQMFEECY